MLNARVLCATVFALVLAATIGPHASQGPERDRLSKPIIRGYAFHLDKDEEIPKNVHVHDQIDVIGDFTDPVKTSIAFLNVELLALDSIMSRPGEERTTKGLVFTAGLTPVQGEVAELMVKNKAKIRIKLNEAKPRRKSPS